MHDSFIRSVLSDKSVAADYFQNYLPASISQILDFSTLTQVPDTYVSEDLQKSMSDIVYDCKTNNSGKEIKFSLLVEHKSHPDKYTPVQIGSYIFSALQKQIANKETLSLVIPVLLYHGKDKWQYHKLNNLFEHLEPGWEQFIPDFSYVYNNLGDISDNEVEALTNKFLVASLLTLKHAFESEWLEQNALRMLILVEDVPDHLLKPFVIYLFDRSELKEEKVIKMFESLSLNNKNKVMSTLDYFTEKGKKKGEEKKSIEVVKNLLVANRFTVSEIANFANVTEAFVLEVKQSM